VPSDAANEWVSLGLERSRDFQNVSRKGGGRRRASHGREGPLVSHLINPYLDRIREISKKGGDAPGGERNPDENAQTEEMPFSCFRLRKTITSEAVDEPNGRGILKIH